MPSELRNGECVEGRGNEQLWLLCLLRVWVSYQTVLLSFLRAAAAQVNDQSEVRQWFALADASVSMLTPTDLVKRVRSDR